MCSRGVFIPYPFYIVRLSRTLGSLLIMLDCVQRRSRKETVVAYPTSVSWEKLVVEDTLPLHFEIRPFFLRCSRCMIGILDQALQSGLSGDNRKVSYLSSLEDQTPPVLLL